MHFHTHFTKNTAYVATGAHGTSHYFVSREVAEYVGKPADQVNAIICHLGNGGSVSVVRHGKCIDTSMGLTPLEGLVMGTSLW